MNKYHDLYNFGGNGEKTILRDGERCVLCGITRSEHKNKWDRDLTVDHIRGRITNDFENLQTLCLSCHSKKDFRGKPFIKGHESWNKGTKGVMKVNRTSFTKERVRRKLTWEDVCQIRLLSKMGRGQRHLGRIYGVSHTTIQNILRFRIWLNP